jgi:hypothetical protein
MGARTSVTTIVTTVLITLITFVVILTMTGDHTANIIEGVILMLGLLAFAGAMIRSSILNDAKKGLKNPQVIK